MKIVKRYFSVMLLLLILLITLLPWLSFQIIHPQAQSLGDGSVYYFPIIFNNKKVLASTSYYLPTTDVSFLFTLGCEHGQRDFHEPGVQDSVAVLDFSYPVYAPAMGYGAALFEDNPYVPTDPASLAEIEAGVKGFAEGYYSCSGDDTQSNLVIGVGTNNKPTSIESIEMAAAHGAAWSVMVSSINQWAIEEGIFHQVQAYGASDMEVSWNIPEWTRSWISGFEQNGDNFLIHFGDAAGCPYEDNPYWICNNGWELEDLWYFSWGAPSALPLPLIYRNDGIQAKQWAYVSQYSVAEHGNRMNFTGVFTQFYYCEQWGDASWSHCEWLDNTPEEAYLQLTTELNKYPSTAQELRWKTDIRWIYEYEISQLDLTSEQQWNTPHPIYAQIDSLRKGIESPNLSTVLQSSLQSKLNISESIAAMIESSRKNPASKNTPFD